MDTTMIPIDDIRAKQAKRVNEAYDLFGVNAVSDDKIIIAAFWKYASKSKKNKVRAREALDIIAGKRDSLVLHSVVKKYQYPSEHIKRDVERIFRTEDSMTFDDKDDIWRCVHCHWEIVANDENFGSCHCETLMPPEPDTKEVRKSIRHVHQENPHLHAATFIAALDATGYDITTAENRLQAQGAPMGTETERLHDLRLFPAYEKAYDSSDGSSSDDTESEGDSEDEKFIDDSLILNDSDIDDTSAPSSQRLPLQEVLFPELSDESYKIMTDSNGKLFYELLHGGSADEPLGPDNDPMLRPPEPFGAEEMEERDY